MVWVHISKTTPDHLRWAFHARCISGVFVFISRKYYVVKYRQEIMEFQQVSYLNCRMCCLLRLRDTV